ncbi:MAG: 3-dehydroquinate synthase [Proteobacteria bacterium]|nr:3-dehydroquinate synthase [Pseudomonadota bacterium]
MIYSKIKLSPPQSALPFPDTKSAGFDWALVLNNLDFTKCLDGQSVELTQFDRFLGALGASHLLNFAFAQRLDRNTPWDITNVSVPWRLAIKAASRVYKRGVKLIPADTKHISIQETEIIFLDSNQQKANDRIPKDFEFFDYIEDGDFIVIDKNFYDLNIKSLSKLAKYRHHVVNILEREKTHLSAVKLSNAITASVTRIVTIGGGVLGDLVGFVASQREIQSVYIPTTLLSMADSSVGGKTGINFEPYGKNQVGAFHFPAKTIIEPKCLATLPMREIYSGLAECLKHAFISNDRSLWDGLIEISRSSLDQMEICELLKIVQVKADIVSRDPFEYGERALLNFGHTLGHALETFSIERDGDQCLSHGQCVIVGMIYAIRLAQKKSLFKKGDPIVQQLLNTALVPSLNFDSQAVGQYISNNISNDKKASHSKVRWVLPSKFGAFHRGSDNQWTVEHEFDSELFCNLMDELGN